MFDDKEPRILQDVHIVVKNFQNLQEHKREKTAHTYTHSAHKQNTQ